MFSEREVCVGSRGFASLPAENLGTPEPQMPAFDHQPRPYSGIPKEEVLSLRRKHLSPGWHPHPFPEPANIDKHLSFSPLKPTNSQPTAMRRELSIGSNMLERIFCSSCMRHTYDGQHLCDSSQYFFWLFALRVASCMSLALAVRKALEPSTPGESAAFHKDLETILEPTVSTEQLSGGVPE